MTHNEAQDYSIHDNRNSVRPAEKTRVVGFSWCGDRRQFSKCLGDTTGRIHEHNDRSGPVRLIRCQ
jgi:hypothetical protein